MPVYLRLSRVFGVTLVSLLTGKISPTQIVFLDLADAPCWRNLWARRRFGFDREKAEQQMDLALREFPPRSLKSFEKRNRHYYATLYKHFPEQCRAIRERFREYSGKMVREKRDKKLLEFRKIAHELHEQGIKLVVNRIRTRMSVPRGLDHRTACELLAEIKREIAGKK